MTAQERYRRFQSHSTTVTSPWSLLGQEGRDAWQSFNEEIEDEKAAAAQRAVRDYQSAVSLGER